MASPALLEDRENTGVGLSGQRSASQANRGEENAGAVPEVDPVRAIWIQSSHSTMTESENPRW